MYVDVSDFHMIYFVYIWPFPGKLEPFIMLAYYAQSYISFIDHVDERCVIKGGLFNHYQGHWHTHTHTHTHTKLYKIKSTEHEQQK